MAAGYIAAAWPPATSPPHGRRLHRRRPRPPGALDCGRSSPPLAACALLRRNFRARLSSRAVSPPRAVLQPCVAQSPPRTAGAAQPRRTRPRSYGRCRPAVAEPPPHTVGTAQSPPRPPLPNRALRQRCGPFSYIVTGRLLSIDGRFFPYHFHLASVDLCGKMKFTMTRQEMGN